MNELSKGLTEKEKEVELLKNCEYRDKITGYNDYDEGEMYRICDVIYENEQNELDLLRKKYWDNDDYDNIPISLRSCTIKHKPKNDYVSNYYDKISTSIEYKDNDGNLLDMMDKDREDELMKIKNHKTIKLKDEYTPVSVKYKTIKNENINENKSINENEISFIDKLNQNNENEIAKIKKHVNFVLDKTPITYKCNNKINKKNKELDYRDKISKINNYDEDNLCFDEVIINGRNKYK